MPPRPGNAISTATTEGHAGRVLRNWVLGFLAIAIWTTNYLVYFAPEIRAWRQRARRQPMTTARHGLIGPLPPHEQRPFPPPAPPPTPAREAEIIPFPNPRRRTPD